MRGRSVFDAYPFAHIVFEPGEYKGFFAAHEVDVTKLCARIGGQRRRPHDAGSAKPQQIDEVLMRGIEQFLYRHPQYDDFRLDVLSITQLPGKEAEYFFIEDVT